MKKISTILIFFAVCLLAFALPGAAVAQTVSAPQPQTISGDQLVIGNNYVLKSGQTINGSLVVLGGNAVVEPGATVDDNIALVGGNLDFSGLVKGNISLVGGNVSLRSGAVVQGDIDSFGGTLNGENLAKIYGQVNRMTPRAFFFNPNPGSPTIPQRGLLDSLGSFFGSLLSKALQALGMAVLALLLGLIIAKPLDRVATSFTGQPWLSVGTGVLTILVGPIILVLLSITIILIPFTLLSLIALALAVLLGWVAVGYEVGKRLMILFKTEWAEAVSAGIGTLILGVAVWLLNYVPCIGWLAGFIVASLGLGGVILSRFGTQYYSTKVTTLPAAPAAPISAPPPAPVQPPAKADEETSDKSATENTDEPNN